MAFFKKVLYNLTEMSAIQLLVTSRTLHQALSVTVLMYCIIFTRSTIIMTFGDKLAKLRREQNYTQE